jgi:hypothetical protein
MYGAEGPYLFGVLSAADAFYLPVVTRFATCAIETDGVTRAYMESMLRHPAYLEWCAAAVDEPWIIAYSYGLNRLVVRRVARLTARHMHRRTPRRKIDVRAGRDHHKA